MEPGQVAIQGALWGGAAPDGLETMVMVGAEVPVSHTVAPVAWFGVRRGADGTVEARDGILAVLWQPVNTQSLVVQVQPGLSIPTGGIGGGLTITPLSTGSVDPWGSANVVVGTQWMGNLSVVTRVPVYRGFDGVRQGPFVRADLRLARRLANAVPLLGVSVVRQASGGDSRVQGFTELAATATAVINVSRRWSLTAQIRVPVWVSEDASRVLAGGLGARWVVGSPPEGHSHDDDAKASETP